MPYYHFYSLRYYLHDTLRNLPVSRYSWNYNLCALSGYCVDISSAHSGCSDFALYKYYFFLSYLLTYAFSALTLLVGRQEGHPACKKTEWWGAGVVICLERGADLHMAQRIPLPLTVSCFIKIQIGFTFLVPAHPGSPGQRAVICVLLTYTRN